MLIQSDPCTLYTLPTKHQNPPVWKEKRKVWISLKLRSRQRELPNSYANSYVIRTSKKNKIGVNSLVIRMCAICMLFVCFS